jgi:hypothetical protein
MKQAGTFDNGVKAVGLYTLFLFFFSLSFFSRSRKHTDLNIGLLVRYTLFPTTQPCQHFPG